MKQIIDLSIVIPTLNEEHFIGILLDSIATQTVDPKEVVVVDAFSTDKTLVEIKKRQKKLSQLTFYQIPKDTISKQRNFGAKKTDTEHILFLDADVRLRQKKTLEKYLEEVTERGADVAAATNLPLSTDWKNKVFFRGIDMTFRLAKPFWPMALGTNMYINRKTFNESGGFDEKVRFAEDHEIIQRLVKSGKRFLFLNKPKIHTSTRRIDKEGKRKYTLKMAQSLLYIIRVGYSQNPTDQQYGHF